MSPFASTHIPTTWVATSITFVSAFGGQTAWQIFTSAMEYQKTELRKEASEKRPSPVLKRKKMPAHPVARKTDAPNQSPFRTKLVTRDLKIARNANSNKCSGIVQPPGNINS